MNRAEVVDINKNQPWQLFLEKQMSLMFILWIVFYLVYCQY